MERSIRRRWAGPVFLFLVFNGMACAHDRPVVYPHDADGLVKIRTGREGRLLGPRPENLVQGRDWARRSPRDD